MCVSICVSVEKCSVSLVCLFFFLNYRCFWISVLLILCIYTVVMLFVCVIALSSELQCLAHLKCLLFLLSLNEIYFQNEHLPSFLISALSLRSFYPSPAVVFILLFEYLCLWNIQTIEHFFSYWAKSTWYPQYEQLKAITANKKVLGNSIVVNRGRVPCKNST